MRDSKGREFQSGPDRRIGKRPASARHIPWPDIFKHHISLVEGHLEMLDMVRRHTVPESDHYRTINQFVAKAKEMLYASKETERIFISPADQIFQVPLDASSASIYPSYSPAGHEYGKAAEEYGRVAANARAQGEECKRAGVDYKIGQGKGLKRRKLSHDEAAEAAKENVSGCGLGSGSDRAATTGFNEAAITNGQAGYDQTAESVAIETNPHFFINTKPSLVNLPGVPYRPSKRSSSPPGPIEAKKTKKHQKKHDGDLPGSTETGVVEFEDISAEVDARMKEKEERRRKKERKRKRETEGSSALIDEEASAAVEVDKPKKKKSKIGNGNGNGDAPLNETISKKRQGEDVEGAAGTEGKAKKKRRNIKSEAAHA